MSKRGTVHSTKTKRDALNCANYLRKNGVPSAEVEEADGFLSDKLPYEVTVKNDPENDPGKMDHLGAEFERAMALVESGAELVNVITGETARPSSW